MYEGLDAVFKSVDIKGIQLRPIADNFFYGEVHFSCNIVYGSYELDIEAILNTEVKFGYEAIKIRKLYMQILELNKWFQSKYEEGINEMLRQTYGDAYLGESFAKYLYDLANFVNGKRINTPTAPDYIIFEHARVIFDYSKYLQRRRAEAESAL